ncbi:putative cytosol aminopeptidase [Rubripirellula lacrimiformis]|uniref:Probable cytosol aminopeptidase n=1 Tax=Rubripirellula lacrimiformis TaxID=1930273 RepID=A0A517NIT0_9BACT|nr:leucyl aminopeptidase [Rubripirellula lacrimiformis]QDT06998.1 putative cytosol aminopeptidase [Rubripirellula lacrimiformis]
MLESLPLPSPQLTLSTDPLGEDADVLVVGLSGTDNASPLMVELDKRTDHWLTGLVEKQQLRSKKGEMSLIASPLSTGPTMLLVVGLGNKPICRADAFDFASAAIRHLSDRHRKRVVIALAESMSDSVHDSLVAGSIAGCEGQAIYQAEPTAKVPVAIAFAGIEQASIRRGEVIGTSINHTRRLVNEPPAMVYPESFAAAATRIADDSGLQIEIWDEAKLEAEGCRAIMAVGKGSAAKPRLVILKHNGGGDEAPIALVGKGVTFDSGGLSLKPSDGMIDMKCDMAGAATVVGVMRAIAKLGVKQNVIGLCGLAENMVSSNCYKLGDVIETRSGKTIEIRNTDAEGRVVLADTLDVAIQHSPRSMVDLATLTGACMVALGNEVAGLMPNDVELCRTVEAAAAEEGEPVWQLPMLELYNEKVKSKIADIKNVGEGRWGGAITAAKFLENFVGDVPWVHIDIAGPAFADSAKPKRDAGATGVMVRTLVRWIEDGGGKPVSK